MADFHCAREGSCAFDPPTLVGGEIRETFETCGRKSQAEVQGREDVNLVHV